jgi:hypothetical protein
MSVKLNGKYLGDDASLEYGKQYDFNLKEVHHEYWVDVPGTKTLFYNDLRDFFTDWTLVSKADDIDPILGATLDKLMKY